MKKYVRNMRDYQKNIDFLRTILNQPSLSEIKERKIYKGCLKESVLAQINEHISKLRKSPSPPHSPSPSVTEKQKSVQY